MSDHEADWLSDSEVTDILGNKEVNHQAKDLIKRFMYIISLIYRTAEINTNIEVDNEYED